MSLYSVYSPVTNGEIVLAALEVINRLIFYFTDLENREDLQQELRQRSNLLQFRRGEKNSDCCLIPELYDRISGALKQIDQVFGVPWKNNKERINILSSYWLFRDMIKAQVEAPQYPCREEIFGGSPFLLSEEKILIDELMAGLIDDEVLLTKIESDLAWSERFSPLRFEMSVEGACRNFQKGIVLIDRGKLLPGLEVLVRSFIIFLPTGHLWWRKWIVNFLFSREPLAEIIEKKKDDFISKLLLEESERQDLIVTGIDEFNKRTDSALVGLLDFEWLNSPCEQASESQIAFGLARGREVWWAPYRKK